jgi:hypothetical protein
MTETEY